MYFRSTQTSQEWDTDAIVNWTPSKHLIAKRFVLTEIAPEDAILSTQTCNDSMKPCLQLPSVWNKGLTVDTNDVRESPPLVEGAVVRMGQGTYWKGWEKFCQLRDGFGASRASSIYSFHFCVANVPLCFSMFHQHLPNLRSSPSVPWVIIYRVYLPYVGHRAGKQ